MAKACARVAGAGSPMLPVLPTASQAVADGHDTAARLAGKGDFWIDQPAPPKRSTSAAFGSVPPPTAVHAELEAQDTAVNVAPVGTLRLGRRSSDHFPLRRRSVTASPGNNVDQAATQV